MHDVRLCLKLLTESKKCKEHGTHILMVRIAFRERNTEREREKEREREREREKKKKTERDDEINRWIDRPRKRF